MSEAYRDPTFDKVAARERRDCSGCEKLVRLWGMSYCAIGKWSGVKNMRRCESWKWCESWYGGNA